MQRKLHKNIGLHRVFEKDKHNFTTNFGIKFRKRLNPLLRKLLPFFARNRIHKENYPSLEKGKTYIFCTTHSFDEDVVSVLSSLDRNAWLLAGTTEQIEYNPQMYAAWVNGLIYVNRMDVESRKDSVKKMERILKSGSSILMYPEGGYNNTENLLVQKLFAGPWILANLTGCEVVAVAVFHEYGQKDTYVRFSDPISLNGLEKKEALSILRDVMATMMYKQMELYSTNLVRKNLSKDARKLFMEERKNVYLTVPWSRDVWEEELTVYKDKDNPLPVDVWSFVKNVKVRDRNVVVLHPMIRWYQEEENYNFLDYMKRHWRD